MSDPTTAATHAVVGRHATEESAANGLNESHQKPLVVVTRI